MGIFNINNSQVMLFGTEMAAAMNGTTVLIATLPVPPSKLIFDNQGTVAVAIYINGTASGNLWRTFPGGEAIVIDLNDPSAKGPISAGTTIYGNGASGTFSISYLYFKTA